MRETLFMVSSDAEADRYAWKYLASRDAEAVHGEGDCATVLGSYPSARLVVLVPAEAVYLTTVKLPIRQTQRLAQAVPYALEDRVADDIDELHFALGARQADGSTPVAVVSHAQMEAWLLPFAELGRQPDWVVPDVLTLPFDADRVTICHAEQQRILVRTASAGGFCCPPEMLDILLPADSVQTLQVFSTAQAQPPLGERVLAGQEKIDNLLDVLNGDCLSAAGMNLLQGQHAPQRASAQWLRALRLPAALAASWILLATAVLLVNNQQQQRALDELFARSEATFRQAFPDQTRIVDMRLQAQQALAKLRSSGKSQGFLPLLSESAPQLAKVPGLKLESMQYRDGSLYLSLSGSDLQALERLRAEFASSRALALEVQSAQAGTEGVQIRLKVDKV